MITAEENMSAQKVVILTNDERDSEILSYLFYRMPDGSVKVRCTMLRRTDVYHLSYAEARALYNRLLRSGYTKF